MKKIVWLLVSSLMVAALLLASCAPAAPPEEVAPPEEAAPPEEVAPPEEAAPPGPEVPKYGGSFTGILEVDLLGYDDFYDSLTKAYTLQLTNETIQIGDWTKGPAGTGELTWWVANLVMQENEIPLIAESYEIPDPNTVVIHVRKGIHFALNAASEASRLAGGREMTAEDVAFSLERNGLDPKGYLYRTHPKWMVSATATDKYTVLVKCIDSEQNRTAMAFTAMFSGNTIKPREVIEKYGDLRDWRNSVGTGAFMLVDVVPASSYTLKKNPTYWMKDPLHPKNQLPYLDDVTLLFIPDMSTRLAAIRTAKADWAWNLSWEDGESLVKTTPELQYKRGMAGKVWCLFMRTDKPELPFDDVRVRRALYMATDLQAIKDELYGGNAELLASPVSRVFPAAYTPLEQMPESVQELFRYNPEKAKQLLAEAGYPNGFKTKILCFSQYVDMLSVIKDQWTKIGVDLQIDQREYTVFKSIQVANKHEEMVIYDPSLGRPHQLYYWRPGAQFNMSTVDDPILNDYRAKMFEFEAIKDPAYRNELMKKAAIHEISQAYEIQLPVPDVFTVWWPWVQNYHGEISLGQTKYYSFMPYIWVDQALKKSMRH